MIELSENHIYTVDGKEYPGVTSVINEILQCFGCIDKKYMIRGNHAHKAIQYYDEGTLDESTVRDEIRPFVSAWKKFKFANKLNINFQNWKIEQRYKSKLGYCGTIDRHCDRIVLDAKTGPHNPSYEFQLHAYHQMLFELDGIRREMYLIQLKPDGEYKIKKIPYKKKTLNEFLIMLSAYKIKKRLNLIQKKG